MIWLELVCIIGLCIISWIMGRRFEALTRDDPMCPFESYENKIITEELHRLQKHINKMKA